MTSFPFDAVLFDLDGTLVATERYWPDAARSATLAFFAGRGIERPVPGPGEWLAMVGLPPDEAFAATFPDLDRGVREELRRACQEAEASLLARGHAAPLDHARETLAVLQARGVRLGVASNCGPDYLDAMLTGLGLERWIEEARCLSSPGVKDKADMIADLLLQFDTRSAVMVGDRRGDRDSAWANGLPFVHIPRGYGAGGAPVEAEATLDGLDQLVGRLEERERSLVGLLGELSQARCIGVVGLPMAGKSLIARDLVRMAEGSAAGGLELEILDDPEGAELARCDRIVAVTAAEDVLVRRARGLRQGMRPVESLLEALPAARAALARLADPIWVNGGNSIDLT